MSAQRSGRGPRSGRDQDAGGAVTLGWALLVLAAALIGGLAAAALAHVSLVVAVIVAVVAGVIAVAVFRSPRRAAPVTTAPVTTAAPPATTAAAPAGPAVQLLPLPADGSSRSGSGPAWWDAAQGGPPPPSRSAQRAPAPDLSTYLASTFIAQCPRCGAFRLDLTRAGRGWDFRCESCEYVWTWQPGTPWPPVRVMPGRRHQSRPPSA